MGTVFDIGNLGLMFWQLITFAILLLLLYKFVYPPIRDQIIKRQRSIEQAIDEAEQTRAEARRLLEEYRQQIAEARGEARQILEEARRQGEAQRERTLREAREEGERIIQRAREEIERERAQALSEIRREVADMVIMASEQVVRKSLEREDHERLIEEALRELDVELKEKEVTR
ncbi:ATP synthase F0 subunit B [Rubrobacter taiwanensis]|jgi:F-type H+-transporting ATPase subunit b|uniref:ATP synthase subunit b n=1 Tax=Rubrobacter taiwanensis TaxID=185139 RepID=A0A4R1BP95_9ACTN|nr:F0F1 ATP synthase subunit B [Rubrobacter taiwanensis]TCJ19419.1 ATP synthase F0 subunit B [Rubrobacter taiwanensis]